MNPALPAPVVVAVVVAVAAASVVVVAVVALLAVRASRRRWQAQLDAARADLAALSSRLDDLAAEPAAPAPAAGPVAPREFVITSLTDPGAGLDVVAPPATHLTAGRFASVAAGESLVRVLSFGYGVRRALSAENRNRIRFEMRREVKASRRRRRRDLKEAKRHLRHVTTDRTEDAA
jgi:hypothetical protein